MEIEVKSLESAIQVIFNTRLLVLGHPTSIQSSEILFVPGLVNFLSIVACQFCLALPVAYTQPGTHLLADPCTFWFGDQGVNSIDIMNFGHSKFNKTCLKTPKTTWERFWA